VAGQWSSVGVQATPRVFDAAAPNADEVKANNPGIWLGSFTLSPTAFSAFTTGQIATAATRWKGSNSGGYSNPAYDRLFQQFGTTLKVEDRAAIFANMLAILAQDAVSIPLYTLTVTAMVRSTVH